MAVDTTIDAEVSQFRQEARRIAAGGWKRALVGFALGAVWGGAAAAVMTPEDGERTGREAPWWAGG